MVQALPFDALFEEALKQQAAQQGDDAPVQH